LITPPRYAGILLGVTRGAVIELATAAGYTVKEEMLNRYDIYTADEAFLCGTASEIIAIRSFDGRSIGTGDRPVVTDLAARFRALVGA